jgi:hypothetical protein
MVTLRQLNSHGGSKLLNSHDGSYPWWIIVNEIGMLSLNL